VKSVELIESGPGLNIYGSAAKYGVLIINTNSIVVPGKKVEQPMSTHMDFKGELSESKFSYGPKGNLKTADPLVVVDGVAKGKNSEVGKNYNKENIFSVRFSNPTQKLIRKYGELANDGVVFVDTKKQEVAKKVLKKRSTSMEIKDENDEFKDYIFRYGVEKNMKVADPLVVVDNVAKGLQSQVGRTINKDNMAMMQYSGPNDKLTAQYGSRAKDGVVHVTSKAASLAAGSNKAAGPSFQKEIEASLKVFPNPFGKQTRINFNLPEAARTKISVFNASGQLVKVLQDAQLQAGQHQVDWNSERSPSGNYTVVIESLNTRISKTIIKQ
ncbi:MAG: T9SS type A sorting domain-containing protein, partial [Bacteroidota bacterium]